MSQFSINNKQIPDGEYTLNLICKVKHNKVYCGTVGVRNGELKISGIGLDKGSMVIGYLHTKDFIDGIFLSGKLT